MNINDLDPTDYTVMPTFQPMNVSDLDPNTYKVIGDSGSGIYDSYVKPALGLVQSAMNKVDSYTGAPMRAGIMAAENAPDLSSVPGAVVSAVKNQFGADNSTAPTGKQINAPLGIPDTEIPAGFSAISPALALARYFGYKPTYADVAGAGTEMAANPLNALPLMEGTNIAAKAGDVASGAVDLVTKPFTDAIGSAASRVGEEVTGINKELIKNYLDKTDEINKAISEYGSDPAAHASDIRTNFNNVINQARTVINNQISRHLNDFSNAEPTVPTQSITERLLTDYTRPNEILDPESRASIKGMMDKLDALTDENGDISVKDLYDFKKYAQKEGASAYNDLGDLIPGKEPIAMAAKNAAAVARDKLINYGPPAISVAEDTLSDIHKVQDTMNKNLFKPESAMNSLYNAGANPGGMEARTLKRLSNITGYDFLQDAKDYATVRQFSSTGLAPVDATGKSVARQLLVRGVGNTIGSAVGIPAGYVTGKAFGAPQIGTYFGNKIGREVIGKAVSAIASPAGIKAGINIGNAASKIPVGLLNTATHVLPSAMLARPGIRGLINGQQ